MFSFHTIFPSEDASLSSYSGSALRSKGFRLLRQMGSPQGLTTLRGKEGTPERGRAARSAAEGLPSIAEVVPDARRATKAPPLETASLLKKA